MSRVSREEFLKRILSIIKKNPGIRPSEIGRKIGLEHFASLRNTLIKRGLIEKKRDGAAVRYYPV